MKEKNNQIVESDLEKSENLKNINSNTEYIRLLEMSLEMLQREVEHLRNQLKPTGLVANLPNELDSQQIQTNDFSNISTRDELIDIFFTALAKNIPILDLSLFLYNPESKLQEFSKKSMGSNLFDNVKHWEEQGIIDFALDNNKPMIIPDFKATNVQKNNFLILPQKIGKKQLGVFVAEISVSNNELTESQLEILSKYSDYASIALDNIQSKEEIKQMNLKLSELNNQMLKSSRYASLGEIAASISNEIKTPLQIITANIQLIESGLGDSERRLQIIKQQVSTIDEINQRLSNLSENISMESSPAKNNICSIIDEALLFTSSRLQRDGIIIEKSYESDKLFINAVKHQIEQLIINLLLISRDSMPDGGKIHIGVYKNKNSNVAINISDTGNGFELNNQEEIAASQVISSFYNNINLNLYFVRKTIEQHKGKIAILSELGKGTTFKITLPLIT